MKKIFFLALSCITLSTEVIAQTNITNDISENTVWDLSGSPYVILNTIFVNEGISLTIEPGVTVKFDSATSLIVKSTIMAQGENSNPIIFTSNKSTPKVGDWGSVRIDTSSGATSLIEYANFSYATFAVWIKEASPTIQNCEMSNTTFSAVQIDGGSAIVENNNIHSTKGASVFVGIGTPTIKNNILHDNEQDGIFVGSTGSPTIHNNIIFGNLRYGINASTGSMIFNNTIDQNGTAINCDNVSPTIFNNIITNHNMRLDEIGIRAVNGAAPILSYNDIWNNGTNYFGVSPGVGDISLDSKFVDQANRDYGLQPDSPCIDAGDPNSPLDPDGTRADMGAIPFQQATLITNDISKNTVWDILGSPYIIFGSINVQDGISLIIDPGVEVRFGSSFSLSVFGKITAVGTVSDSIFFTSNMSNPSPLDWERILIKDSGSDESEFKYCKIQFARVGISFENTSAKMSNSLITKCDRSGISVDVGSPTIKDNMINGIVHEGIHVASGTPLIEGNTIYNNIDGIITDFASSIIKRNIIYNNSRYGVDNRNANDQNIIATIDHNTIDNNGDAGINCDNSNPMITNNIITNTFRVAGNCGGAGIRATSNGFPTSRFNDLWNNLGGNYCDAGNAVILSKEGDISADPMYVDASNGDYHVQENSPCIDAGDPNSELDSDGTRTDMGALSFEQITSVEDINSGGLIEEFSLSQNYPNPFNPSTQIEYSIPKASRVVLKIYNLYGQEIRTLVDEQQTPGIYRVSWNGRRETGCCPLH